MAVSNDNVLFEAINPFKPGALVFGHWQVKAYNVACDWYIHFAYQILFETLNITAVGNLFLCLTNMYFKLYISLKRFHLPCCSNRSRHKRNTFVKACTYKN